MVLKIDGRIVEYCIDFGVWYWTIVANDVETFVIFEVETLVGNEA